MAFFLFYELLLKLLLSLLTIAIVAGPVLVLALTYSQNASIPRVRGRGTPAHLLIVLGSGGHTTEMFYILEQALNMGTYTHRTYLVTSGDKFSANKAIDFEAKHSVRQRLRMNRADTGTFDIVTVPRARRVHQSYWTAPFTTLQCLWACLLVLCGRSPTQMKLHWKYTSRYPDCIVSNGPAVAVCIILAAKMLRAGIFIRRWLTGRGTTPEISRLRTIYVESWARVCTMSTTGVLLLPLADKFVVQWPQLAGRRAWWGMKKTEYAGWLVM